MSPQDLLDYEVDSDEEWEEEEPGESLSHSEGVSFTESRHHGTLWTFHSNSAEEQPLEMNRLSFCFYAVSIVTVGGKTSSLY